MLANKATAPSGWVSKHFLKDTSVETLWVPSLVANQLSMLSPLTAHVNGWLLKIADTGSLGSLSLDLGAAPAAPAKYTNLVVLEVWRKLLSAAPSTDGKSPTGKIWRYGNVKYADDPTNLTDDILNTNVGSETTKRVQIQYRLRVISDVDLVQYPEGISDPSVVAHSVPVVPASPDGVATAFAYVNQSPNGDSGLWRAGDGNPANALNTVDGYMYAIPLVAVFRRNSTAWNRNSNQNGGVASPGPSDRPDQYLHDIIEFRDIADLRRSVSLTGFSPEEVANRAYRLLLDNQIRTEFGSTQFGPTPTGGMDGHTLVWCDQIGVPGAGDGIDTGNAVPAGALIRTFDGVCRRFSDRSIVEVVTIRLDPNDQVPPAANWGSGNTVLISPTALKISPSATPTNFAAYAPASVSYIEAKNLRFVGNGAVPGSVSGTVPYAAVSNLGAIPVAPVSITLGNLASVPGLTNEPMYLDLVVQYPEGVGLQRTPTNDFGGDSVQINNVVAMPADYGAAYFVGFDYPHKELRLTYTTIPIGPTSIRSKTTDAGASSFRLPEQVTSVTAVTRNTAPLVGGFTLSSDGRTVTLTNAADFLTFPDTVEVTYIAERAFPQNGEQVSVFYETRVFQCVKEADLPTNFTFMPRYIGSKVTALSAGSATPTGEAYPFPQAYVQTGGLYNTSLFPSVDDSDLGSTLDLEVQGMTVNNGFVEVSAFIPFSPTEPVELVRVGGDDDAEGRTFYKAVPGGSYLPNAFASPLAANKVHKCFFPVLGELLSDQGGVGRKGQWVLVLFIGWVEQTNNIAVAFEPLMTANTSTASVFRITGNPLVKALLTCPLQTTPI